MNPNEQHVPSQADVFDVAIADVHPAEVIGGIHGSGLTVPEYTVTPGAKPDLTHVHLVVPHDNTLKRLPWYRSPDAILKSGKGVEKFRSIAVTARHHMHLVLQAHHPDAHLLVHAVMCLGGHVKRAKEGLQLGLTADLAVIDRLYAFLRGMPGLSRQLRINPVYESMAVREDVDDLVPQEAGRKAKGEERILRVTGDGRGDPDKEVLRHLEGEGKRVEIVSLSRRPVLPDANRFEMIMVLRADPRILDALPADLLSHHVGIDGAHPVAPGQAQQYVQIVPDDAYDAKGLVRANKGLQVRHKRIDRRPVVTGSVPVTRAPQLLRDVRETGLPNSANVPIMPGAPMFAPLPQVVCTDLEEPYRQGMLQLLRGTLPEEQG